MSTHRLSPNCVCVCVWFQVSTRLLTSQRWHIPSGILTPSASAWSPSSEGAGHTHTLPLPPPPSLCWMHHMTSLPQHVSLLVLVVAHCQEVRREEVRECPFRYDRTSAFKREWTRHRKCSRLQAVSGGIRAWFVELKKGGCSLIAHNKSSHACDVGSCV